MAADNKEPLGFLLAMVDGEKRNYRWQEGNASVKILKICVWIIFCDVINDM